MTTSSSLRQKPIYYYHLAKASYQKDPQDYLNKELGEGKTNVKEVTKCGSWSITLFKDDKGTFSVAFRGTACAANVVRDIRNQFEISEKQITTMGKVIEQWEEKYEQKISDITGYSAGGLYASHVLPDRTDIPRITLNAHKVAEGDHIIPLALDGDIVSCAGTEEGVNWCVGQGGHKLDNFKEQLMGRSWKDLKQTKEKYAKQKFIARAAGRAIDEGGQLIKHVGAEVIKDLTTKTFPKFIKTLCTKGTKAGFKTLQDEKIWKNVLDKSLDYLIKRGEKELEKALGKVVEEFVASPNHKLFSKLLSFGLSKEDNIALCKDAIEDIDRNANGLNSLLGFVKESKLLDKLVDKEFLQKLYPFTDQIANGLRDFKAEEKERRAVIQESKERQKSFAGKMDEMERDRQRWLLVDSAQQLQNQAILRVHHGKVHGIYCSIQETTQLEKNLREESEKLRTKIDNFKTSQQKYQNWEKEIRELNKQIHESYRKKMKHLGNISKVLSCAQLVAKIAVIANPAAASAMAVLNEVSSLLGLDADSMIFGLVGHPLCHLNAKRQQWAAHELQRGEEANAQSAENVDTLLRITDGQLSGAHQAQQMQRAALVNNRPYIAPPTFREELEKVIEDNKRQSKELEERIKENNDKSEKEERSAQQLENKSKEKDSHKSRISNHRSAAELAKDDSVMVQGNIDRLAEEREDLERQLEMEKFLAPIRDRNYLTIQREVKQWEGSDPRAAAIRHTMCADHEAYLGTRRRNSQPVMMTFEAAGGLARELGYLTGNHKVAATVEVLSQLYSLYDLGRYWADFAIPQLSALSRVGTPGNNEGPANDVVKGIENLNKHLETIGELSGGEAIFKGLASAVGVIQYAVPAIQVVTAVLCCGRLIYNLYKGKKIPDKQQELLKQFQEGMKALSSEMKHHFQALGTKLDDQHRELLREFERLSHSQAIYYDSLFSAILKTRNETKKDIANLKCGAWIEGRIEDTRELRAEMSKSLGLYKQAGSQKKSKFHLSNYVSAVNIYYFDRCQDDLSAGAFESRRKSWISDDREDQTMVDVSLMPNNPKYHTCYLARKFACDREIPNAAMYLEACMQFLGDLEKTLLGHHLTDEKEELQSLVNKLRKLGYAVNRDREETLLGHHYLTKEEQKDLLILINKFREQGHALRNLEGGLEVAIERAAKKQNEFIRDVLGSVAGLRSQRKKDLNRQLLHFLKNRPKFEPCGASKQNLNRLIHNLPLRPTELTLRLNNADNWCKAKFEGTQALWTTKELLLTPIKAAENMGRARWFFLGSPLGLSGIILNTAAVAVGISLRPFAFPIHKGIDVIRERRYANRSIIQCCQDSEKSILGTLAGSVHMVGQTSVFESDENVKKGFEISLELRGGIKKVYFHVTYCPEKKNFGHKVKYKSALKANEKKSKWKGTLSYKPEDACESLQAKVAFDLVNQTCKMKDLGGPLSPEFVQTVEKPNIEDENAYNKALNKLYNAYTQYLKYNAGLTEDLGDDNPFKECVGSSVIVHSVEPGQTPLAFPKRLINNILHEHMQPFMQMEVMGSGYLEPKYRLKKVVEKGETFRQLQICFFKDGNKEFEIHTVATFDENTYLAFGGMHFPPKEKGYDVKQEDPDLNEFLIQMMYTSMVPGLGMPGAGTRSIPTQPGKNPLIAPVEQHGFPGLWKMLHDNPDGHLSYDSRRPEGEVFRLSYPPKADPGHDYDTITTHLNENYLNTEKKIGSDYRKAYDELTTLCKWTSGISHYHLREKLQKLGLHKPRVRNLYAELDEEGNMPTHFPTVEDSKSFIGDLRRLRSEERILLDGLLLRLGEHASALSLKTPDESEEAPTLGIGDFS